MDAFQTILFIVTAILFIGLMLTMVVSPLMATWYIVVRVIKNALRIKE